MWEQSGEVAGTGVNLKIRFSIGAQAGYKIGKKTSVSVNLNSVDLVWAETGTNGSSWGLVDDYGVTTNRRGISIGIAVIFGIHLDCNFKW